MGEFLLNGRGHILLLKKLYIYTYFVFSLFIRSSSTYAKIQEYLGRTPPRIQQQNALLACLAQRLSAFTSRCGTDTAGQGALEPSPEDVAGTKLFDREFQFRESHTEAETKKNS